MHNVREKICALSGLPLPYDVIHEICGYNFYDKETSILRDKKREIMKTVLSESNCGNGSGTWWFLHSDKNNEGSIYLLCDFCLDCGNYIYVNRGYIHFIARCICVNEDDYYSYEDEVREFKEDYWLFGY